MNCWGFSGTNGPESEATGEILQKFRLSRIFLPVDQAESEAKLKQALTQDMEDTLPAGQPEEEEVTVAFQRDVAERLQKFFEDSWDDQRSCNKSWWVQAWHVFSLQMSTVDRTRSFLRWKMRRMYLGGWLPVILYWKYTVDESCYPLCCTRTQYHGSFHCIL